MNKINLKISQVDLEKIAKISELYSSESLASKLSCLFKIEQALSSITKFEGIHNQIIKSVRQNQKTLQNMLRSPVLDLANQAAKQSHQLEHIFKSSSFNAFQEIYKQNKAIQDALLATSSIAAHALNKFQNQISLINLQSIDKIASSISKLNEFPKLYKEIDKVKVEKEHDLNFLYFRRWVNPGILCF